MKAWHERWHQEGGYRQVLLIAVPLILSTGAWSVQHFVDRMFLTWYSPEAIAASMPAGMVHFTLMSLFLGTAGYTNTFVAQYYGAGRCERIGPVLWQGAYIGGVAAAVHAVLIPLGPGLFQLAGHEPLVQELETAYFQVLCLGAGPGVMGAALAGFFTGRGRPWTVMWVNAAGTTTNLLLDYALIFGHWGFPQWGITGAGLATVAAMTVSCLMYLVLLLRKPLEVRYRTRSGWRLNTTLLKRLLSFGLPSGGRWSRLFGHYLIILKPLPDTVAGSVPP
jgi:MATE family multidrug resistance protein